MDIIELVTRAYADGLLAIHPPKQEKIDPKGELGDDEMSARYTAVEYGFADGLAVGMSLSGTIAQKMGVSV